jgi:hypothetical protein
MAIVCSVNFYLRKRFDQLSLYATSISLVIAENVVVLKIDILNMKLTSRNRVIRSFNTNLGTKNASSSTFLSKIYKDLCSN